MGAKTIAAANSSAVTAAERTRILKLDNFYKNLVLTIVIFLLMQAYLPDEMEKHRHLYLLVQETVLFLITAEMEESKVPNKRDVTVHVLMIYLALIIQHKLNAGDSDEGIGAVARQAHSAAAALGMET